jgi:ferredoxin/flavodoxin---NADP+ reductase
MDARLRVVIVGAGPAGLYAADALTFDVAKSVQVDLLDRLPTPFGLLRHGVAPDHLKIKSLEKVLQRIIDRPAVRFMGNITVGKDVERSELLDRYDAVIYATGAPVDRRLNIGGENLPGSVSASDFVAWYNAYPECSIDIGPLSASRVAVLGAGNVALDVARMLLISRDKLKSTDVAERALRHLRIHKPDDVYVIGRRSAAQAKFTPKELRELGDLEDVDIIVSPEDLLLSDTDSNTVAQQPQLALNMQVLHDWASTPPKNKAHRLHFRFLLQPERIEGEACVRSLRLQTMDPRDTSLRTGRQIDLDVGAVIRAIGFTGQPFAGIPHDAVSGTIRNVNGRVLSDYDGVDQEFVTGWARRGSTGVIGSNRADATEVAELVLSSAKPIRRDPHQSDLLDLLGKRGVTVVTAERWSLIDLEERKRGTEQGRPRIKLESTREMLDACRVPSRTEAH